MTTTKKRKVTKKLIENLQWLAKQPGRSHHDASIKISPREARDLLSALNVN